MASDDTNTTTSKVVEEARSRFKKAKDWEQDARNRQKADVRFCEGDSDNKYQWEATIYEGRVGRDAPALTINKTRQHCLQIVNDARQNKAQIRIRPVGDGATYEAAKVFEGVCRHIEYISNAMEAYDAATWHQVTGGMGLLARRHGLHGRHVRPGSLHPPHRHDPLSVYLDPDIRSLTGRTPGGASSSRIARRMTFEAELSEVEGEARPPHSATMTAGTTRTTCGSPSIIGSRTRRQDPADRHRRPDGRPSTAIGERDPPDMRKAMPKEMILRERDAPRVEIEWFKIVGDQIVERAPGPASISRSCAVVGEETIIDGELDRKGHTRALKDPQRMYNFWSSSAVEHIALQTKAPWVRRRAFEGHETYWANANRVNAAG
jgi:hypothetical protein